MMSKKWKGVSLLGACILLIAAASFAQTVIKVADVKGAPGSTVQVDITATGDGIAGVNFTVNYDSAVLANPQVILGDLATEADGFTLDQNVPQDGEIRAVIYPPSAPIPSFKSGEGVLAKISFEIADAATACTQTALNLEDGTTPEKMGVSDNQGVSITGNYDMQDGSVLVTLPGDFNSDSMVDMLDFTLLVFGWETTYDMIDFTKLVFNWEKECD